MGPGKGRRPNKAFPRARGKSSPQEGAAQKLAAPCRSRWKLGEVTMKKSKRKKSEHRRHGSHAHSQPASSESSPRKASSESTTPRSNSGLSPQNPCSVNVSQKPSSEDILQQPSSGATVQHFNVEVTSHAPSSGVSPQRSQSHQQYLSPEVSTQTSFFSKQPQTNSTQEENLSNACLDRCESNVKPAFPSKEAGAQVFLFSPLQLRKRGSRSRVRVRV